MKFKNQLRAAVAGLLLCLSAASCMNKAEPPPPARTDTTPRPADVEHRVSYSGETLALIAAWYTGKGTNWTVIRDANPGLRPERMNIGQRVIIPGAIVVERRPLPKKFLQDNYAKVKTPAATNEPVTETNLPPTGNSGGATDVKTETPPNNPPPSDEVNLDEILKQQIEEHKKAEQPPKDDAQKEAPPAPAKDTAAAPKADKAPGAPGDTEREKLLDELLTQ